MSNEYSVKRGELGWALEHIRMGKKIRRNKWSEGAYITLNNRQDSLCDELGIFIGSLTVIEILADDWELFDAD